MDRGLNLKELADRLLSLSHQFESAVTAGESRQALALLGTLQTLTRGSLPVGQENPDPVSTHVASALHAGSLHPNTPRPAKAAPAPQANYDSSNSEYKPALKDQALVQALLGLHKKASEKASLSRKGPPSGKPRGRNPFST